MLGILVFTGLGILALTNTNDNNENIKGQKKFQIDRRIDNMTTYEIDKWLKENGLYFEYGSYSRQYKIDKVKYILKSKV